MSDGQLMLNPLQSLTTMLKLHRLWLLAPSVAVQLTMLVPTGKLEPEGGEQLIAGAWVEQLSEPVTLKVTLDEHCPVALHTVMSVGQRMVGLSQSLTVTAKKHLRVLPAPSVAVQLTMVRPI